ncbi:MAG: leucine-rich repeat protein [Bacteroidales bacterium]|nr:leucine-rich repeat protein [Candidatus Hennigimonas equi]
MWICFLSTKLPWLTQSNPSDSGHSWHWFFPAGGTFESATAGTFQSDITGTFQSDTGGTFILLLSVEYIGNWSFGNCKKLVSMNIPQSVKELVLCAISGTSIKDIFIVSDAPDKRLDLIEALRGCQMKNITLHVPQESIYMYRCHPVFEKFQNIVCSLSRE